MCGLVLLRYSIVLLFYCWSFGIVVLVMYVLQFVDDQQYCVDGDVVVCYVEGWLVVVVQVEVEEVYYVIVDDVVDYVVKCVVQNQCQCKVE